MYSNRFTLPHGSASSWKLALLVVLNFTPAPAQASAIALSPVAARSATVQVTTESLPDTWTLSSGSALLASAPTAFFGSGSRQYFLLEFDLNGIDPQIPIQQVLLTVQETAYQNPTLHLSRYEGSGTITTNTFTGIHDPLFSSSPIASTAIFSELIPTHSITAVTYDLTSAFQAALDAGWTNFGLAARVTGQSGNGLPPPLRTTASYVRWAEAGTTAIQPQLTIAFVPEPSTYLLASMAAVALLIVVARKSARRETSRAR